MANWLPQKEKRFGHLWIVPQFCLYERRPQNIRNIFFQRDLWLIKHSVNTMCMKTYFMDIKTMTFGVEMNFVFQNKLVTAFRDLNFNFIMVWALPVISFTRKYPLMLGDYFGMGLTIPFSSQHCKSFCTFHFENFTVSL